MSRVDTKQFYNGDDGRGRSRDEPSPEFPPASNDANNLPQPFQVDFESMNDLSMYDLSYLPASPSPGAPERGRSEAPLGLSPFESAEPIHQFNDFSAHSGTYPPGVNFNDTLNASSDQSGFASNTPHVGFSPESFISAPSLAEISYYNTPAIDESLLEAQLGRSLSLDPSGVSIEGNMSGTLPAREIGSALNGFQQNYSDNTSPYPGSTTMQPALSPGQVSPSLAASPGGYDQEPSRRPRLLSPTVTVEYFGRDESPRRSRVRRNASKRSHEAQRSNMHLSPYPDSFSSSNDGVDSVEEQSPEETHGKTISPTERSGNGIWVSRGATGVSGIGPDARKGLLAVSVPTLDELKKDRELEERNADVEDWLAHSEVGSDTSSLEAGAKKLLRISPGRPRARSANDVILPDAGLGVTSINDAHIVGPGVLLNEPSEMDYYDDGEQTESPAADINVMTHDGQLNDDDNASSGCSRPWADHEPLPALDSPGTRTMPLTSNAAMMRFKERAKEVDNASLAATVGSGRRRSESDLGSVVAAAGISKPLLRTADDGRPTERKGTLFGNLRGSILPNRAGSGKLKRKGSQTAAQPTHKPEAIAAPPAESQPNLSPPKRIGSFGRPKSPKLDTNVTGVVPESRSPISGIVTHAKGMIRRNRSRSDLGKSPKSAPGIAVLWGQHGGPPVARLASPLTSHSRRPSNGQDAEDDSGDEEGIGPDGVVMDLTVRTDLPIFPTYHGFKYHTHQLNPRVKDYLLERLTQEQLKRYKRLGEYKTKHAQSISNGNCASKSFCFALGGEAKQLPPHIGNKNPEAALVGFQIMSPGMTEADLEVNEEGQVIAAQFPPGVPLPPVKRLPAEFECPLCFKVKKFHKPSDWTKHVHEDVQPFTCTFPNCSEPKSFKRKADWVRHENERHRQLESWSCNIGECSHTCYRKDNFVQHLVREHKVPEPKVRTGRSANSRSPITPLDPMPLVWPMLPLSTGEDTTEDVWALVEKCRRDSSKIPREEVCRFCGNVCSSWKKLTVHLAKHMEQISMPVLGLIEQRQVGAPATPNVAHAVPRPSIQQTTMASTMALNELPAGMYCAEPSELGTDSPTFGNGVAAQMMQTYPPPNVSNLMAEAQPPTSTPYVGQTYPPMLVASRSRSPSFNEAQTLRVPDRTGSSYPPAGLQSAAQLTPHLDQQQGFLSPQTGFSSPNMLGVQTQFLSPAMGTPGSYGYAQQDEEMLNSGLHGTPMGMPRNFNYGG